MADTVTYTFTEDDLTRIYILIGYALSDDGSDGGWSNEFIQWMTALCHDITEQLRGMTT